MISGTRSVSISDATTSTQRIAATLGHSKVTFAPEVYDHASVADMQGPLTEIASQLLPIVTKGESNKLI